MKLRTILVALGCGLVFGAGLAVSGLTRPETVIGFLDVTGRWNPSLAIVMAVAVAVNAAAVAMATQRRRPLWASGFGMPSSSAVDRRLLGGAAVFGVGWGLLGVCPGPALASASTGDASVLTFVVSMTAGLLLVDAVTAEKRSASMMTRWTVFLFGSVSYLAFLATFLYAIGFVGGLVVPTSLDGAPVGSIGTALVVDGLLLTIFALQHSVMARPWFKAMVTRHVPAAAERSLYVLCSSLALVLVFWLWQPIGGTVWDVANPAGRVALHALFALGWATVLVTTFLIDHFDLFGLRQVWLFVRGRPYTGPRFTTPGPYRHVRHPLYVGWLLAFWATPTMTTAHLFFATVTTAYILVAIRFEERDLAAAHGTDYVEYRRRVPMLVPRLGRRRAAVSAPRRPALS
jgi:methanethiol S-methyltransferase